MTSLLRFHYDPFTQFDRLLDDAFNTRVKVFSATPDAPQPFDSLRPR